MKRVSSDPLGVRFGDNESVGPSVSKRPNHTDPEPAGSSTESDCDEDDEGERFALTTDSSHDSDEEREGSSGSESDNLNDPIKLSETITMFPHHRFAKRRNVVAGEFCDLIDAGSRHARVVKFDYYPDKIFSEAKILRNLAGHSNIISLYGCDTFHDKNHKIFYLTLERCHDLNLEDFVHNSDIVPIYDVSRGVKFCRQIMNGMKFIHEKLIIHKDIKAANILLSHCLDNAKLADFGSSEIVKSPNSKVRCLSLSGTLGYRPPESLEMSYVSLKSDIYSLGILFVYLLSCGGSPLGESSDKFDHNTLHGRIEIPDLHVENSVATKHLIESMLRYERCRRPAISKVEKHPCWSNGEGYLNHIYPYEEETEDCETPTEESTESSEESDEFLRILYTCPRSDLHHDRRHQIGDSKMTALIEKIQSCINNLLPDAASKLSTTLARAAEKLLNGLEDEGVQDVRNAIPQTTSADVVHKIGKELDEVHPVSAVIMHRVYGFMFSPHGVPSDKAVEWIGDRIADISCVAEHILNSDTLDDSDPTIIKVCLKFMEKLLHDLNEVQQAGAKTETIHEVGCILSISRIVLKAADRFKTSLNPNTVKICLYGLQRLEASGDAKKHKFYGYILNNIGEAYLRIGQLENAERYLKKALTTKKAFSYRSRETRDRDIGITKSNLDKLQQLGN